jgi:hypothetical protein
MAISCHGFLCYNNTIEEDDDTLLSFSSSQTLKKQTHKKKTKKNQEKGRRLPSSSCSTLSLLALASAFLFLPFCFKHFLLASFFSQT